ncbi:putative lipid II flippase FtsW [bacterium]|nr:putative lipid II flippase FtsW [bacterium]
MKSHITNREDRILIGVVLILILIGVLMVYSASSFRGAEQFNDPTHYLKLHAIRVTIGLVFFYLFSKIDYHRFRLITPFVTVLFLVFLVIVLFGQSINGSHRSLQLMGNGFQPSEFMKIILIFYLAALFSKKDRVHLMEESKLIYHYLFFLSIVGLVFIEPDMGTALILFFVGFSMFFLGGIQFKRLFKMGLMLLPIISIGMLIFPYQRQRLVDFLNSLFRSGPISYQVKQSIIGLAQGGFLGVGYGGGKQKLFFLPEPFSDFILANLGEELGFIGIFFVFVLLIVVLWRGIRIAFLASDRYGYLMAGGITVMILINALINAGVVVHLLPTTGLPFPFISYGGSSLLVHMVGVGVLLNISRTPVVSYKDFTLERGQRKWWDEGRY